MRKIFFLLFLASQAKAQYYQRQYSVSGNDFFSAASAARNDNGPYIMAGISFNVPNNGISYVSIVRTGADGTTSPTGFSSRYELKNGTTSLPATPLGVYAPLGTALFPTPFICATGKYAIGNGMWVLCLNSTGGLTSANQYMPSFHTTEFIPDASCASSFTENGVTLPNRMFVTGHVNINGLSANQGVATFVMRVNMVTNTVDWFRIYNLNINNEQNERETPAAIAFRDTKVVIAGNAITPSQVRRGFVFAVNPTTGDLVTTPQLIQFPTAGNIKAISPTNTSSVSLPMHLAGDVPETEDTRDFWVCNINVGSNPGVNWSKSYNYSGGGDNFAESVINFGGKFYAAGTVLTSVSGAESDKLVYRLDAATGNVVWERKYGETGTENCSSVSSHTLQDGVCFSGNHQRTNGTWEFSTVSAYSNGVSGCNEVESTTSPVDVAITMTGTTVVSFSPGLSQLTLTVPRINQGSVSTDCAASSVPGGANVRLGQDDEEATDNTPAPAQTMVLYPNPVSAGTVVSVDLNFVPEAGAQFIITDIQGRVVSQQHPIWQEGSFQAGFSTEGISPGVYMVQFQNGAGLQTQRLIIQ